MLNSLVLLFFHLFTSSVNSFQDKTPTFDPSATGEGLGALAELVVKKNVNTEINHAP